MEQNAIIGTHFGHFVATRLVDMNGMEHIYEGRHTSLVNLRVWINVLAQPWREQDEDLRYSRFLANETNALSRLRHPSILQIFDSGTLADGTGYFITENLDGLPLRTKLNNPDKPLPVELVVHLASQIASAMSEVHNAGFVHLDIKPDNIFIVSDNDCKFGVRVKITDFAISIKWPNAELSDRKDNPIGTLAYMSPEQCNCGDISDRSDVYSLGIILYETLTSRHPFAGAESGSGMMMKHIFGVPMPLRKLDARISPAMEELIHQMLAKAANRRPSMKEVVDRLTQISVEKNGLSSSRKRFSSLGERLFSLSGSLSLNSTLLTVIIFCPIANFLLNNLSLMSMLSRSLGSDSFAIPLVVLVAILAAWAAVHAAKNVVRESISRSVSQTKQPTRASIRKLLERILVLDSDLDAFCVDHFPFLMKKYFTAGMQRNDKISIMLQCIETVELLESLRESYPVEVNRHRMMVRYRD